MGSRVTALFVRAGSVCSFLSSRVPKSRYQCAIRCSPVCMNTDVAHHACITVLDCIASAQRTRDPKPFLIQLWLFFGSELSSPDLS